MKQQWKGILITATGAALWGINAVAGKYVMGVKGVDPVWMVTLRLITAGLMFLAVAAVKSKGQKFFRIWRDKNSVIRLLIVAIFAFAICQASYFAAIDLSNAGITTAIQQTSPVFVLLWVLLLEKRLPKKVEILVLILVIAGAFMLATGGSVDSLVMPLNALILALISAVTCAMYTVLPAKLIERYGTFYAVGWGMFLAGIFLIPVSKLWNISGNWDIKTVLAFSFVVVFGTVGAFGMYLYGVTLIGPLKGSVLGLIEPVVAALASVILLNQVFLPTDLLGIGAIIVGVAILSVYKGNE